MLRQGSCRLSTSATWVLLSGTRHNLPRGCVVCVAAAWLLRPCPTGLPCLALQSSRSAPCLRHHHLNQASSSHLCRPTKDQSWPANSLTLHDPSTLPDPVGSLFPVFACSSAGVVGSPALSSPRALESKLGFPRRGHATSPVLLLLLLGAYSRKTGWCKSGKSQSDSPDDLVCF